MKIFFAVVITLIAVTFRMMPHPANFVPMGALAMFLFATMPRRQSLPLFFGAMLLSDILIGFYDWKIMVSVYASFALMGFIGQGLISSFSLKRIVTASLAAALSFFLITNFTVWFFGSMYAHNLSGLTEAYAMAIPFFRNSLMADFFWSVIFFGAYERIRKRKTSPPAEAALVPSLAVNI